jgi:alginate O-acetyltransferase complex protein AlgI
MALAGLWHGAGWPFVVWGIGHGLWLLLERHLPEGLLPSTMPGTRLLKTFFVFHGVCLLWVFFRAPSLSVAADYFGRLLAPTFAGSKTPHLLTNWLIAFALLQWPVAQTLKGSRFISLPLKLQWPLALGVLYLVLAFAGAHIDFIYFNF